MQVNGYGQALVPQCRIRRQRLFWHARRPTAVDVVCHATAVAGHLLDRERNMSEAVRLTVVPEAAHVMPGARVSLSLTVQNTGGSDARYRLAVGGIPEAWCTLDKWHLTLGPGGHEQVQITVQPPRDNTAGAGSYSLTVGVISEDDPNTWLSTIVPLTLHTADGVTMDVAPPAVDGREARFRITYLNLSDAPVAVALVARDNEDALRFTAKPDTPVIVPAGGGGPVTVHVVPKERKTFGEHHPYEIEFRGVQLGAEQATNPLLARRARFVYVPRYKTRYLPRWVGRAPGGGLLPPFFP